MRICPIDRTSIHVYLHFAAVLQLTVLSEMSDHSTTSDEDEDEITRSNEVHVGDDLFSSSEVYNYLVSKQYRGKHYTFTTESVIIIIIIIIIIR